MKASLCELQAGKSDRNSWHIIALPGTDLSDSYDLPADREQNVTVCHGLTEKSNVFLVNQTLLLVFVKFALKMSRVINPNMFFCSVRQNSGSESFKVWFHVKLGTGFSLLSSVFPGQQPRMAITGTVTDIMKAKKKRHRS